MAGLVPSLLFPGSAREALASCRDVFGGELTLLGWAEPTTLPAWFDRREEAGTVIDPLAAKPGGASDGQVVDRFSVRWLIGYED